MTNNLKEILSLEGAKDVPYNVDSPEAQQSLNSIWEIIESTFYQIMREGEIKLRIPSEVLVKFGLVSKTTSNKIKNQNDRVMDQPAVNTVVISPVLGENGFLIREEYVTEEDDISEGERLDIIVEEISHLEKEPDGKYKLSIVGITKAVDLRALGISWIPEDANTKLSTYKSLAVTYKRVMTTLALLDKATERRKK